MTGKPKLAVLILGIAGLLALVVFLLQPDPGALLRGAQEKLVRAKTVHVEATGEFSGTVAELTLPGAAPGKSLEIAFTLSTDLDRTDPMKPSSQTAFEFRQKDGAAERLLAGETRRVGTVHYVKLSSATMLELTPGATERLIGHWFKSDRPMLERIIPPAPSAAAGKPLDAAGMEELQRVLGMVSLLHVEGVLPDEDIDGRKHRHFAVTADMDALAALLFKLRELRTGAPVGQEDALRTSSEIVRWGQPAGEAWISRKDGRFGKIALHSAVVLEGVATRVDGELSFSRYDAPIAIQAPDAQPLESALEGGV